MPRRISNTVRLFRVCGRTAGIILAYICLEHHSVEAVDKEEYLLIEKDE